MTRMMRFATIAIALAFMGGFVADAWASHDNRGGQYSQGQGADNDAAGQDAGAGNDDGYNPTGRDRGNGFEDDETGDPNASEGRNRAGDK